MTALRLSVLDQSPVPEGATGVQALRATLDLARDADRLGFHRYWVAEHHGGPMTAGPAPEILIGAIAAATRHLRVGSGGVMLPHYSPFKVAEAFSLLAGLHPGRIDLGLGRAAGTDGLTALALQRDRRTPAADDFPQLLAELLGYLDDTLADDHPFKGLAQTLPGRPETPEPWLLGSSAQSAIWAAQLGLPYAFADFINPAGASIAQLYQERFADTAARPGPEQAVAVWAIAAEDEAEAWAMASSARMAFSMLRRGRLIAVPTPATAMAWLRERGEAVDAPAPGRRSIVGTPDAVRAGIEAVAAEYGAREVLVVTITHDLEARRRSYELIADAFELERAGGAAREPAVTA